MSATALGAGLGLGLVVALAIVQPPSSFGDPVVDAGGGPVPSVSITPAVPGMGVAELYAAFDGL